MARAETLVLHADRMLDLKTGKISGPATIVVSDGVITAVNPQTMPTDARKVELGDKTLLPGLMDMHSHLTIDFFTGSDWVTMPVLETAPDWAIRGAQAFQELAVPRLLLQLALV